MRTLSPCFWCARYVAGGEFSPYEVPKEMNMFHEITRRVRPAATASSLGYLLSFFVPSAGRWHRRKVDGTGARLRVSVKQLTVSYCT